MLLRASARRVKDYASTTELGAQCTGHSSAAPLLYQLPSTAQLRHPRLTLSRPQRLEAYVLLALQPRRDDTTRWGQAHACMPHALPPQARAHQEQLLLPMPAGIAQVGGMQVQEGVQVASKKGRQAVPPTWTGCRVA